LIGSDFLECPKDSDCFSLPNILICRNSNKHNRRNH